MLLKLAYTVFLGFILALFVGIGIAAFYPQPKAPDYPESLNMIVKEPNAQQQQMQLNYDKSMKEFQEKQMRPYNRNVSLIVLGFALVFLAISLFLSHTIHVIADGVMLGSVFTLIYSIGRGFAANDSKFSFAIVSVGVIVAIFLGYWRFIRPNQVSKSKV